MNKQRRSLCEKIALIEDELKTAFFQQTESFADVFPQQSAPSWQCPFPAPVKPQTGDIISVCFENRKVIIRLSKILIVEDDDGLRESFKEVLESQPNLIITLASTGQAAINLITHNSFDIIFLDIQLPDMLGFEVLKFSKFKNIETKVYMVSGYNTPDYINKADDLYADGFIGKPFDPEKIIKIIHSL